MWPYKTAGGMANNPYAVGPRCEAVLTLTTDFGTTEYVAQMKGVIFTVFPEARIVDVSHRVLPQNILQGAYVMATTAPHFPAGAVHIGVVDPGVGSERRAIALRCERGWLVGPDNGLLWPAAETLGLVEVREITNQKYYRERVRPTFHGRDIFAPVGAHLARQGLAVFEDLGPVVDEPIRLSLDEGAGRVDGGWHGIVLHVDRFGNVITNLRESVVEDLPRDGRIAARFGELEEVTARRVDTYSQAGPDELVVLVASSGFLEASMNEDSAAGRHGIEPGMPVDLRPEGS